MCLLLERPTAVFETIAIRISLLMKIEINYFARGCETDLMIAGFDVLRCYRDGAVEESRTGLSEPSSHRLY